MKLSPLLDELLRALQCLPGVGPKTAQRMAFTLLERDRHGAERLAATLSQALAEVGHCRSCNTLTELTECSICQNSKRAQSGVLCVVASPADVWAIEQTQLFDGQYFVLMGQLSPLDGIGPQDIGLDKFAQRLAKGDVHEVIIATNPSVEGEATAYYLAQLAQEAGISVSRIAHGIPIGGELEQVDGNTLRHSLVGRVPFHSR